MEKFCSQNYCCYKRHRHRHREFPRQVAVSENHVISKALLRPNRFAEICERRMDKYHEHLKINQQKTHFKFRSAYCHFQNKDCDRRLVIPCGSVTYMGLGGGVRFEHCKAIVQEREASLPLCMYLLQSKGLCFGNESPHFGIIPFSSLFLFRGLYLPH